VQHPPIICLVTGGGTPATLLALIRDAASAGVTLIQIRESSLDDASLLSLTRKAIEETREARCQIVVNDRMDVAVAAGAAGVHLRGSSFSARRIRDHARAGFLIGRSVHDAEEAVAAAQSGCDYVIFGTVFPSRNKPVSHPIAGLDGLHKVATAVQIPVIAIGGISLENAGAAIAAGAAGVAAISLFRGSAPPGTIVSELRRSFDS
jgi:thiamine-phosphate pyrophosphorylase